MFQDYPVDSRSDAEVRCIAKRLRASFAVVVENRVDLVATLNKRVIPTEYGSKELIFMTESGPKVPESEGRTVFGAASVTIILPVSTSENLKFGEVRSRNTAAHEIGHAAMHQGAPMHRNLTVGDKLSWIPPYRSAEHQAKVFAPAFLIDDVVALELGDAVEVAIRFGVSEASAEIYLGVLRKHEQRVRVAQQLRDFSKSLVADDQKAAPQDHFIDETCPNCCQRTLFPVGIKFMCKTCDGVFDRFQDGDPIQF